MLQDFERGRKTEIDFINGYVARLDGEFNVLVRMNAAITGPARLFPTESRLALRLEIMRSVTA